MGAYGMCARGLGRNYRVRFQLRGSRDSVGLRRVVGHSVRLQGIAEGPLADQFLIMYKNFYHCRACKTSWPGFCVRLQDSEAY